MSDCVAVQPLSSHSVYDRLHTLVINSVRSSHSKRAYAAGLAEFWCWWEANGRPALSKAVVQQLRSDLEQRGLAPATINLRLAAVRRLVLEAADNDLVPQTVAAAIARVRGVRPAGVRLGNWLSREQAQRLLLEPDADTPRGLRDRAMLAMLIGCGLRRTELVQLTLAALLLRRRPCDSRVLRFAAERTALATLVDVGRRCRNVAPSTPLFTRR